MSDINHRIRSFVASLENLSDIDSETAAELQQTAHNLLREKDREDALQKYNDRLTSAFCSLQPYRMEQNDIEAVTDLLTDLRIWCYHNVVSMEKALELSAKHYAAELDTRFKLGGS